jgi:hypothetical protein
MENWHTICRQSGRHRSLMNVLWSQNIKVVQICTKKTTKNLMEKYCTSVPSWEVSMRGLGGLTSVSILYHYWPRYFGTESLEKYCHWRKAYRHRRMQTFLSVLLILLSCGWGGGGELYWKKTTFFLPSSKFAPPPFPPPPFQSAWIMERLALLATRAK